MQLSYTEHNSEYICGNITLKNSKSNLLGNIFNKRASCTLRADLGRSKGLCPQGKHPEAQLNIQSLF